MSELVFSTTTKQFRVNLPTWPLSGTWSERMFALLSYGIDLLVLSFPFILVLGNFLWGFGTDRSSLFVFYLFGMISIGGMVLKFLVGGSRQLHDLRLLMVIIMFAVVNMGILLFAGDQVGLLGNGTRVANAGFTMMALVSVFYFLTLSFATRSRQLLYARAAMLASVVAAFIGINDLGYVIEFAPILLGSVPIWLVLLLRSKKLHRSLMRLAILVINILFVLNYAYNADKWNVDDSIVGVQLVLVGVVWVVLSILTLGRDIRRRLTATWNDVRSGVNILRYLDVHWQTWLFVAGMMYLLLAILWSVGNGVNIGAFLQSRLQAYRLTISLLGQEVGALLFGNSLVNVPQSSYYIQTLGDTGVVGLIAVIILSLILISSLARLNHSKSYVGLFMAGYIVFYVLLGGIFLPISISTYVWWVLSIALVGQAVNIGLWEKFRGKFQVLNLADMLKDRPVWLQLLARYGRYAAVVMVMVFVAALWSGLYSIFIRGLI